jgi:hypothetical protein
VSDSTRFSDKLRLLTGRMDYRACEVRPEPGASDFRELERFNSWREAVIYASEHSDQQHVTCVVQAVTRRGRIVRTLNWLRPDDDGQDRVREPRRPYPGSSSGAVELDLPE